MDISPKRQLIDWVTSIYDRVIYTLLILFMTSERELEVNYSSFGVLTMKSIEC